MENCNCVSPKQFIILKNDTPLHKAGTRITLEQLREDYSYICSSNATNEQLADYLFTEKDLNEKMPHSDSIANTFEIQSPPQSFMSYLNS